MTREKFNFSILRSKNNGIRRDARLAYFQARSTDQTPEFEMGVRYRENGIVEELTQDYGTYTIIARLNQLELLPPGKC